MTTTISASWFRLLLASGGASLNARAVAYRNAVVAAGGTMSSERFVVIVHLTNALKAAGVWDAMDDFWFRAGENSTQSLMSLKRLVSSVPHGSPAPLYATNRGIIYDGTQNYLDTLFSPLVDGVHCANANTQLSIYEIADVESSGFSAGVQTNGNGTIRINPNTGNAGNGVSATVNSTSWLGPPTENALGLTSVWRSGTTYGVYFNGVNQAGTTTPSVNGNSQALQTMFEGCASLAGTAANFRPTTVAWLAVGSVLTEAQDAAHYAAVQAALLAIGAFDIYLSADSYGGIPAGNDSTGVGTIDAPWATLDKGLANLNPFGELLLNGNPASPSIYQSAGIFGSVFNASCVVNAIHPLGAAIAGNNASVSAVIGATGGTLEFNDILFDPSVGATPGATAVRFSITASAYTATFNDCKWQNWTAYALAAAGATMRANIVLNNPTFVGDNCSGASLLQTFDVGSVTMTDGSTVITNQLTAGVGGHVIGATNTGPTCEITNHDIDVTLKSTLVGGGKHAALRIQDIPNAVVTGCTNLGDNNGTARGVVQFWLEGITLGCNGGVIDTCLAGGPTTSGIMFLVGEDASVDRNLAQNCSLIDCGTTGVIDAGCEVIVFGSTLNGLVDGGTFVGGTVIGAKDSTNFTVLSNVTYTGYGLGFVDKGNVNSSFSGTLNDTVASGNIGVFIEENSETLIPSTGGTYTGITITVSSASTSAFIVQDATSTIGSLTGNTLTLAGGGTLNANPVQIGATDYATGAAFVAAYPGNTATGW